MEEIVLKIFAAGFFFFGEPVMGTAHCKKQPVSPNFRLSKSRQWRIFILRFPAGGCELCETNRNPMNAFSCVAKK